MSLTGLDPQYVHEHRIRPLIRPQVDSCHLLLLAWTTQTARHLVVYLWTVVKLTKDDGTAPSLETIETNA